LPYGSAKSIPITVLQGKQPVNSKTTFSASIDFDDASYQAYGDTPREAAVNFCEWLICLRRIQSYELLGIIQTA